MSTRERPRDDKPKEKEVKEKPSSVEDWLDSYEKPKSVETAESKQSSPLTEVNPVEQLLKEFTSQLPKWVQKPWMYVKPTHEGHFKNWITSWKGVIMDYCEILSQHIVSIYDLQEVHPFTNKVTGKELSADELRSIIGEMVDQNIAKWLEDDIRARIYFKTDQEWADILYQFALDQGYATDIMTLFELKNLNQTWSLLPETELALVLDKLVDQNKAEWVGSDRDTIQFMVI